MLRSSAKHFTLTVAPSIQARTRIGELSGKPVKMLGDNLAMALLAPQPGGSSKTPSRFILYGNRVGGPLGREQTLTLPFNNSERFIAVGKTKSTRPMDDKCNDQLFHETL